MLKTLPKQSVRKEQNDEEGRGSKTPSLLVAVRTFLLLVLGRLLRAGRGYALAGAGVVAAAVVAVSLLSWLAPNSDRPIAGPLEAVGRVASNVVEQVDSQVQAMVGTDGEKTILRSLREGIATVSSVTPWPSGKSVEVAFVPSSSSTASPNSASSSADDATAPTREESSPASDGAPSEPAPSAPSQPSETPIGTNAPPSPVTSEPVPPPAEEGGPPVAEGPSLPPVVAEEPSLPPVVAEEPPAAEEPAPPPSAEEPPPAAEEPAPPPSTEEPPPTASDPPPPPEGPPPEMIADK